MDYKRFVAKYFKGERIREIERNVTPGKYEQLFGSLSDKQMEIISDKESRCIVVAAGPGSGKTRVLVHKLASLLLLEDVKHEQLLMLTF
jgi:ATP-dependent DNA helicase RecQ